MKIGVDLDGVLFDSERMYRTCSVIYEMENKLNGEVNPNEPRVQKRYNWNDEQIRDFFDKYRFEVLKTSPVMFMAKEVLKKLKCEGHELFVITSRGSSSEKEMELTKKRLKREKIKIDAEFYSLKSKLDMCKKLNIDIMIDDYYEVVEELSKNGIKCLYFKDVGMKSIENTNVKEVRNWAEIYKEIKNINK